MGGKSSKPDEKNGIYAELVPGGGSDIPPIKVLLNEQITSTAVDSLKDSEHMMHLLAKNMILDALHDKKTVRKFGMFLQSAFESEETLSETRKLVYWSLNTQDCTKNTQWLASWQLKGWMQTYGVGQTAYLASWWVSSPDSRRQVISPLIAWAIRQDSFVTDPLAVVATGALPLAKVIH